MPKSQAVFIVMICIVSISGFSQESGLSPEYKLAAEDLYKQSYALEMAKDCFHLPNEQWEAFDSAQANATAIQKTEADTALQLLIEAYSINILYAQAAIQFDFDRPDGDCTLNPADVSKLTDCRAAVETGLRGGPISEVSVCEETGN